jgi:hypothetical protein
MNKLLLSALCAFAITVDAADPVPYPKGYRNWTHVKSMVINPGHPLYDAFGGIHHLYANKPALAGYRSGKFADGSVIVFDLLDANAGGNAVQEGSRKVVGVMRKDAAKYGATGGWGFEAFKAGKPVVGGNAAKACFECHTSQKERDYVFSTWRD